MALADFQDLVDALVRDSAGIIATAERDQAIALAVTRYSSDRPRAVAEDVAADGTKLLALPPAWEDGFSRVTGLESPPDEVPPTWIEPADWGLYETPAAVKIALASPPAAGASVRVRFTRAHQVDAGVDTVPVKDREAVANWAAALLLDQLAAAHAGDRQPTIQADSVDHASKSGDYGRRANACRKLYFDHLGIDPKRTVAAGAVTTLTPTDSRGQPRLLRGRRGRL